ncbi:hypothetical protein B0I73DRAFT_137347, partial [Yarrowia lipolytica]
MWDTTSWILFGKRFHEIMGITRTQDVDMFLQAGDLFHINKPSRKSLYPEISYGERPCGLKFLSDPSLALNQNSFNHQNYVVYM